MAQCEDKCSFPMGNDLSPEVSNGEKSKPFSHLGEFVSFLSKEVLFVEDIEASRQAISMRTSVSLFLVIKC